MFSPLLIFALTLTDNNSKAPIKNTMTDLITDGTFSQNEPNKITNLQRYCECYWNNNGAIIVSGF